MRLAVLVFLAFSRLLWAADAWTPLPGWTVQADGRIQVAGLTLELQHYNADWKPTSASQALQQLADKPDEHGWHLQSPWHLRSGSAILKQTIKLGENDGLQFAAHLADAGPTKAFSLTASLDGRIFRGSEVLVDDATMALPTTSPVPAICGPMRAKRVLVPVSGGWLELSGELTVMIQDNLTWKDDTFSVRILADAERQIAVTLRLRTATK